MTCCHLHMFAHHCCAIGAIFVVGLAKLVTLSQGAQVGVHIDQCRQLAATDGGNQRCRGADQPSCNNWVMATLWQPPPRLDTSQAQSEVHNQVCKWWAVQQHQHMPRPTALQPPADIHPSPPCLPVGLVHAAPDQALVLRCGMRLVAALGVQAQQPAGHAADR